MQHKALPNSEPPVHVWLDSQFPGQWKGTEDQQNGLHVISFHEYRLRMKSTTNQNKLTLDEMEQEL